ncbi:hypothetical protein ACFO0N_11435 [Halobium salinum]|uniref:Amphi-Trp domain-containing protein n=1 Tax=Halobium salinum TaxID=1364940 RepID=A0ABD5PCS9_9EURY|nr:hypothetical protein [Halobium salinum]
MPTNHEPEVTTEDQFEEQLRRLVRTADANGVDVRGGWPVENGRSGWDLEIVETSTGRSDDGYGSTATNGVSHTPAEE